jgi:hypothetical protein
MFFDIFKGDKKPSNVVPFPVKEPPMPKVQPPAENADALYTVGVNETGNSQLRIRNDYGSTVLTMNDAGVIALIEDLAHTIRHRYDVEITKLD